MSAHLLDWYHIPVSSIKSEKILVVSALIAKFLND